MKKLIEFSMRLGLLILLSGCALVILTDGAFQGSFFKAVVFDLVSVVVGFTLFSILSMTVLKEFEVWSGKSLFGILTITFLLFLIILLTS